MADLEELIKELIDLYGTQEVESKDYNGGGIHYYYFTDSRNDTTTE